MVNPSNQFFRMSHPRLFRLLYAMVGLNVLLVAVFVYLITQIPLPQTYASDEKATTPLYAFSEPIVSQQALLDWAAQAAVSLYNFDYTNYEQQYQEMASYFTPTGWELFQNDFRKVLDTVVTKKLRVNGVVSGPPVIVEEGPLLGRYAWKIRMPMLLTYETASGENYYQALLIDMVVIRVPTTRTPKGIAITQFYAAERSARL